MYNGYKIVVNTAAGRRRYMQWLIPYVISSEIVDRYDIWINTHNMADIEFFKRCACTGKQLGGNPFDKIKLVWQPDGVVSGNRTINAFYLECIEEKTIYVKLDDDIIWMEPNAIENMVKFRIDHPEYFLVSPLVINNAVATYLLQQHGKIKLSNSFNCRANHPILWENGDFAAQIHQWFIDKILKTNKCDKLHLGCQPVAMARFSINSILWFGDDMRKFNGVVPGDDEEFLSCSYPSAHGLANCWNGDVIMVHFAFYTQREKLDHANILDQYGEWIKEEWKKDERMQGIYKEIQSVIKYCNENEKELMQKQSPYSTLVPNKHPMIKRIYHKVLPLKVRIIVGKMVKRIKYLLNGPEQYVLG